jgi:hypothetical protein
MSFQRAPPHLPPLLFPCPDSTVSIDEFKKVVPDALDAQGWFRFHGVYADGTPIVKA